MKFIIMLVCVGMVGQVLDDRWPAFHSSDQKYQNYLRSLVGRPMGSKLPPDPEYTQEEWVARFVRVALAALVLYSIYGVWRAWT